MKKWMRYALMLSFILIVCTACAKGESNELLQTEHVPGTEEAVVHTATPSPTMPLTQVVVSPTAVPEDIEPLPELLPEEPAFMGLYRAMAAGTRVNTEGVSEEAIRHCFCSLELTNQVRMGFSGQSVLDWQSVRSLDGIRALYYRSDGKLYICDAVADKAECESILGCFYQAYQNGQQSDDLTVSLPETLSSNGYRAELLFAGNAQYLYIYK